jgi:ATP-dependent Clp protease adaptor protein ClpS
MSTDIAVKKKNKVSNKIEAPGKYKVVVCNDDVTPMDFVVGMLIGVFKHNDKSALELTLKIHNTGSAVAGVYGYEVAEQKTVDGINLARSNGYPLIIKLEPE